MFKEIKDKKFKDHDPEIIAWQRETKEDLETPLMYSYPQPEDNIKNKKFFAVKDYEKALFYNKGKFIGALGGGIYELDKKARIKELDEKKNELQNLLLNDKITQEDYDKKREQIEIFIKEAQEELRKNEI